MDQGGSRAVARAAAVRRAGEGAAESTGSPQGRGPGEVSVFISHGSPMHALQAGPAGEAWKALGRRLPKPRAILISSAHWETELPMLTGNAKPETVHDFYNFPEPLYRLRYPAPGSPQLAQQARS